MSSGPRRGPIPASKKRRITQFPALRSTNRPDPASPVTIHQQRLSTGESTARLSRHHRPREPRPRTSSDLVRGIGRIRVSERWRGWQSLCHIEGVDTESDLTTVDRDFLIAIIAQLQATVLEQPRVIERLERRIAELEGQAKPDGPPRMPGLRSSSGRQRSSSPESSDATASPARA